MLKITFASHEKNQKTISYRKYESSHKEINEALPTLGKEETIVHAKLNVS